MKIKLAAALLLCAAGSAFAQSDADLRNDGKNINDASDRSA